MSEQDLVVTLLSDPPADPVRLRRQEGGWTAEADIVPKAAVRLLGCLVEVIGPGGVVVMPILTAMPPNVVACPGEAVTLRLEFTEAIFRALGFEVIDGRVPFP